MVRAPDGRVSWRALPGPPAEIPPSSGTLVTELQPKALYIPSRTRHTASEFSDYVRDEQRDHVCVLP